MCARDAYTPGILVPACHGVMKAREGLQPGPGSDAGLSLQGVGHTTGQEEQIIP